MKKTVVLSITEYQVFTVKIIETLDAFTYFAFELNNSFGYKIYIIPLVIGVINNGNKTEWSPIRSVIIRVINKIGRPRSRSLIC